MKVFVWRHNRKYHSYSMINEPNVHQDLYTDAVVVVTAETIEKAYEIIARDGNGWATEELKRLTPKVFDAEKECLLFEDVRG